MPSSKDGQNFPGHFRLKFDFVLGSGLVCFMTCAGLDQVVQSVGHVYFCGEASFGGSVIAIVPSIVLFLLLLNEA